MQYGGGGEHNNQGLGFVDLDYKSEEKAWFKQKPKRKK